jgi:DNA transposition AAA+ family ATPase
MRVQLGRFVEELLPKEQRTLMARDIPNYCHLIIVDETERLKMGGIEQFREIYDKNDIGLIFIGMPGLEKQLSRYPQLYSRIGFSHNYRTLSKEEMRFLLEIYWEQFGLSMNPNDYTDAEAIATTCRVTNGNFRLVNRLFRQIERIMKINELSCITAEVVEAARECLVIGAV